MTKKTMPVKKEVNGLNGNSNLWSYGFQDLNIFSPASLPASLPASFLASLPAPIPNAPYFDLRIYREPMIKSLIKYTVKICTGCLRRFTLMETTIG